MLWRAHIMWVTQPGVNHRWCSEECQHLLHLLTPSKKPDEGRAIGKTLKSSLLCINMYGFSPNQHFASDIRTQKAVIFGSFFITFLYSGFGNSLLCKFHRALSTATLSICVLYLYTEPYLLGGRKPQEPRRVHAILFVPSASSDTSGS